MADLTCGDNGSTGQEVISRVNSNTAAIATKMPLPINGKMELDADNPDFVMGVLPNGLAAQMSVTDKDTNHQVASMVWVKSTQTFSFSLMDKDTGTHKNSLDMYIDGTARLNGELLVTEPDIENLIRSFRVTVSMDTSGTTPSRSECINAFKHLPHYDFSKDDDYYIKSTNKDKFTLVKYRADAGSTDENSAGRFWLERLTLAT